MSELLTAKEAAAALRISRTTLWRLVRRGAVQTVYVCGRRLYRLDEPKKK